MNCRTGPYRHVPRQCYSIEQRFADLDSIVQNYTEEHKHGAELELAAFRDQPSFRECIRQAGLARRWDGKRWKRLHHQRRIPQETLQAWANALLRKDVQMHSCREFETLFEVLEKESRKFWRNGELTVYDTALRIGAYHELKLEPKEIYLHAGTREGAKALGFDGSRRSIRRDELPKAFQQLKPYQIEDSLCIYADDLKRLGRLAFA